MFGEVKPSDCPGVVSELAALLNENNCMRLLTDMRDVDLRLSAVHIFGVPDMMSKAGLRSNVRRAMVFAKDARDYRFYEDVSVNRGHFLRVFQDVDTAMEWLNSG